MPDPPQQINIDDASLQSSQFGQAGHDLTQIQNQVVNVTVYDPVNLSGLLSRHISSTEKSLTQQEYRQRKVLLNKVKKFWVEDVLKKSLHNSALIELGMEERLDTIAHPSSELQELPEESRKTLPTGTGIAQVFNQMGEGRTLLILGKPGSGKTTTLLKLAQDLIITTEKDLRQPIPVVFNLSSWSRDRRDIAKWLLQELSSKYQVPKSLGKTWIKNQQLLLLLDGLDEVEAEHRKACVQALNKFIQVHGLTEIVVSSRITDYQTLSEPLKVQGAICVQDLTIEQINQYLDKAGEQLEAVKLLLQEDTVFQEFARSPLTLSIMTLAYKGISVENLPKIGSTKERRQHLFNAYIEKMFKRKGAKLRYPQSQAMLWLIWLAQRMVQESQTDFLIEDIQPSWLLSNTQKWIYQIGIRLIVGLIIGLLIGQFTGTLDYMNAGEANYLPSYKKNALVVLLMSGMMSGLMSGMMSGLVFRLLSGLFAGLSFILISLVNTERINYLNFLGNFDIYRIRWPVYIGLCFGILFFIAIGSIRSQVEAVDIIKWSWSRTFKYLVIGLMVGLVCGIVSITILDNLLSHKPILKYWENVLLIGVALGLIFGITGGWEKGTKIEEVTTPNQSIWMSFRNALWNAFIGGIAAIAFGIVVLIGVINKIFSDRPQTIHGFSLLLLVTAFNGLCGGQGAGLVCLQHFVLRFILYSQGLIPWDYSRFLDYATERILLQRVGGGYLFVHRMLMEHFANIKGVRT